ncbi:MAG TPA: GlxA family transcriptional regulator [Thermoleophilaceae bacterium]
MAAPRRIAILVFDDVQPIDVVGPHEVFSIASRMVEGAYEVEVVAARPGSVTTVSGLTLVPDRTLAGARRSLDTLVVAGGEGIVAAARDEATIRWIARTARRSRRVASVCTGAFLLAEAGLLDGRRATTHWAGCAELARRHPAVDVDPDPIFVRDGNVFTSAGVTAGMDLALALVEEDLGPAIGREVARWIVLFVRRPGGQSQFSAQLRGQTAERPTLRELQGWIPDHLDADLSVAALAGRAHMSERNFARAFRREVGATPASYVEALRVERARIALEGSEEPIEAVARRCGFGTPETMRRAFHRQLGVTPGDYRSRFRPALSESA